MGYSKKECVIKNSTKRTNVNNVTPHSEFIKRIRKSLYFGCDFYDQENYDQMEMSKPLAEYASELFSDTHRGHTLNRLSSIEASSVPTATPTALIMALIYLDRLNIMDPNYVRRITPQELFIVSMMISTKFYAGLDEEVYLSDWAEGGNICENRLKQLEMEFLCAINWNVYISNDQFFEKLTNIESTLAKREGLKRGWLTYNELIKMLPSFTFAKFLLSNITVMLVSYAASVMTIAGAFYLASQIPGTSLNQKASLCMTKKTTEQSQSFSTDKSKMNTSVMLTASTLENEHNHLSSRLLNTEKELNKLEQQYHEEELRLNNLQRQNEISTESRLTLPQQLLIKLNVKQKCAKSNRQQQKDQWFVYKYYFSDNLYDQYKQLPSTTDITTTITRSSCFIIDDRIKMYNGTSLTSFWHFLKNACTYSIFNRMPLLWSKFM